jgi:hypothetical protein
MTHVGQELARDRQRTLLAVAAAQRDGQRARLHGRIARRAERAERKQHTLADQAFRVADEADRLRARLAEIESGS